MTLLSIGEFARLSRLSVKALRLYDEQGLLRPARVDPRSGYRFYQPAQLERAELIGWLRRLDMPLARIALVCEGGTEQAVAEVSAFWRETQATMDARRTLADLLVRQLSGEDIRMSIRMSTASEFTITAAARSDRGLVREGNGDRVHAGDRLFAVADGFGPHDGGGPAGEATIAALAGLDRRQAGGALSLLAEAARAAEAAVRAIGDERAGCTLTAMLCAGPELALVHVGDSRAYLLRDGQLTQLTTDHTEVRAMVERGEITPEQAAEHPRRAILLRALHGTEPVDLDLQLREPRAGDRYLLCTDGLHTVLDPGTLHQLTGAAASPEEVVESLVRAVHAAGAPDNLGCVVADVA